MTLILITSVGQREAGLCKVYHQSMLSSGNKEFTILSDVNSPVSPDAHCASSTSDLGETLSHSNVSFSSPGK